MRTYSVSQARRNLAKLVNAAERGERTLIHLGRRLKSGHTSTGQMRPKAATQDEAMYRLVAGQSMPFTL